jgi:hypothetical protein
MCKSKFVAASVCNDAVKPPAVVVTVKDMRLVGVDAYHSDTTFTAKHACNSSLQPTAHRTDPIMVPWYHKGQNNCVVAFFAASATVAAAAAAAAGSECSHRCHQRWHTLKAYVS